MEQAHNTPFYFGKRFWMLVCLLVSFVVLSPNINNDWVNWDDETFVLENDLVGELSLANTAAIFKTVDGNGGYTPLVLLSWSLDHASDGYNPTVFHTTNVLLHLITVLLVFSFIFLLTGRIDVSVITALLFGIHPAQLEAVAWITARKDLLYGLFYLAGLVTYLKFLKPDESRKRRLYLVCLLFFVGALFSKGAAVTFPLSLLLIDFLKSRKEFKKLLMEKIPFLLLSVLFGVVAIVGQQQGGAIDEVQNISLLESFFVGCYGFVVYVIKAIVPYGLSSYHPYPYLPGQALPWYLYAAAIPAIASVILAFVYAKRRRKIAFGFLFFACSMVLVLQFLPVGLSIVSERFSYIGYIGLFFLVALGISQIATRFENYRVATYVGFALYLIGLGTLTFQRSDVWENSESLWTDVIYNYPNDFLAYGNRADYYISTGQTDLALADLNAALTRNNSSVQLHSDRGLIYLDNGALELALADFNTIVALDPTYANGYLNRGLIAMNMKRFESAIKDFDRCVALDPTNPFVYGNRGILQEMLGQPDKAIPEYSQAIMLDQGNAGLYFSRAVCYGRTGNTSLAKADYLSCIAIDPSRSEAHFTLGSFALRAQDFAQALVRFEQVIALNPNLAGAHINIGLIQLNLGQYDAALSALNRGISLDDKEPSAYLNRGVVYGFTGKHEAAIADFTTALSLAPDYADAYYWRSQSYKEVGNLEQALVDVLAAGALGYGVDQEYLNSLRR
jgi:tetratricopeptide (TPR) repeat protein